MVREAERRKRKYEKNVDGDQVGRAFKAQKDIMVDQEKTYFPQIAEVERKVKKLCEAQGIATYLIAQYINYARECYSKAKRFTQDTLKNELQYLAQKWASRGLLSSKLVEIAKFFGVDITVTPPPAYCRIATGSYAGTGPQRSITGIGFPPRKAEVFDYKLGAPDWAQKWEREEHMPFDYSLLHVMRAQADPQGHMLVSTGIISLDADGFTVHANANKGAHKYYYICLG